MPYSLREFDRLLHVILKDNDVRMSWFEFFLENVECFIVEQDSLFVGPLFV